MRTTITTLSLLLFSCGATLPQASVRVAPAVGSGGPPITELAQRFYAAELDPEEIQADVDALLVRYPGDATVHEMAAQLAELREDEAAAWEHWLRASADLGSPLAAIYIDRALSHDLTAGEQATTMEYLERLMAEHPSPDVRVDAARRLTSIYEARGQLDEAARVGATTGFIRDWRIIGAFDNDQGRGFFATHPPEVGIDLDAEYRGLLRPIRWRRATLFDRTGMVRIADHVSPDQWGVAYLLTHVRTETERDVQLRLTTPCGARVWLNGALVVDQEHIAHDAADNLVVAVHLEAGWNRILIKSAQGENEVWRLGVRLSALDGRALAGLRYDAALHEMPTVPDEPPPPNASLLVDALAEVEPPLRRELLTHHDALRNGYEGDALANARTLLELAPHHPIVIYTAALTHWTNDELGQTMDLLNEAVERFDRSAGFYYLRGSFYRERERYDRAIEDLERALELQPNARFSLMTLAMTFEDRHWREHQCSTLERAVARWPQSGWALRSLGYCLEQRGYIERARRSDEEADRIEPGHVDNLGRLATLARGRQDTDAELAYVDRIRALRPFSVGDLLSSGDHYRYAGHRDEARAFYEEARRRDPVWSAPHHRLGLMAFEDGDVAGALAQWTSALERDPDNGALADRVDFLTDDANDPDRQLIPGQEQIERALARAVDVDPGAHTVLLLDDEVTTVQHDGSARHRITQVSLAVTTDGRDQLIQNQVPSNARVLRAFSVDSSGSRQEASSTRDGVVRFRGLDVGAKVVLQYVYHAAPPSFLPNHYVGSWLFQGVSRQLGDARWVVQVPAGREIAMHIQGPIEHVMTRVGELDQHVFTASDVPPLVTEPQMPPIRDVIAMVTLSTLTDWNEYVEWERALLSEVFESNASLRALAQSLTEGAATPRERIDRLYRHIATEIRYQQDYEDTIAGVRPHSCPVVLERGYGDCKDKAVLMILLARELGLEVRFAVLRTTGAGRVLREVPNQQFNHAIVYVPPQEGIDAGYFMDPTTDGLDMGNLRADDQGALSLVLDPGDGQWTFIEIPYQPADITYYRCQIDVSVESGERATAQSDCDLRGSVGGIFRRAMRSEEQAGQVRQNVAHAMFQGAVVTGASTEHVEDIDHPLRMHITLDVSSALQAQGDERRMRVPAPFALGRLTRLERRRTPLRLGVLDSARWAVSFEVPRHGRIVRAPDNFAIEHACFEVSRHTEIRGRRATVVIDYSRSCPEISPEDYPEFRRQAQRAATLLEDAIVLSP